MKCNKRLKYNNYVAFSHFHGTAVNNSGLITEMDEYWADDTEVPEWRHKIKIGSKIWI